MTIAQIMDIWPIAQYLAANDIQDRRSNSGAVDVNLPQKIFSIGTAVQRIYDADPTDTTLTATSRYLYALCGKYGIQASVVAQTSGTVSSVTPITSTIPQPLDWVVSVSSSPLATGDSSVTITAFIGYNIDFFRGGITQYTTDPGNGGTYYSWDRTTGLFVLNNGDAGEGEQMRISIVS